MDNLKYTLQHGGCLKELVNGEYQCSKSCLYYNEFTKICAKTKLPIEEPK